MNPIVKTITLILIGVNRLIDSLDHRTLEAIKAGFFVLIFILMTLGGILGYRSGMQHAQIKSPPLIQSTNESFELDIKRERRGTFSSVLESKLITEMKSLTTEKVPYPSNETMAPEANSNIIEPEATTKFRSTPDTMSKSETVDRIYTSPESHSVRPITRDYDQADVNSRGMNDLKNQNRSLHEISPGSKTGVTPSSRDRSNTPAMIEKDRGVIE